MPVSSRPEAPPSAARAFRTRSPDALDRPHGPNEHARQIGGAEGAVAGGDIIRSPAQGTLRATTLPSGLTLLKLPYYGSDIAVDDIKKVDLNLLGVLDALLDERNVTRAAARLGYTQPTVSGMFDAPARPLWRSPVRTHSARPAGDSTCAGVGRSVEAVARRQPASRRTQRIQSHPR